jgi:putative ABC transport system ATP-binding protein
VIQPVIEWDGVARTYDGLRPVEALLPTDLAVQHSEYTAVIGPSGSGKSTLLNILGLLDRPSAGTYKLAGVDLSTISDAARTALRGRYFGFVFQAFHLLPHLTVLENVELGMLYGDIARKARRIRARNMVERVGMSERLHAEPATLSGGERQRVAIARALVRVPSVLLCDEPTGNLDSTNAAHLLSLLDELNADGTAVVIVTHDRHVADHATRVIEMRDGRIAADTSVGSSK